MNDFEKSKIWSDRFISEIKRNLGEVFIVVASFEDDTGYNTDLIMPNGDRISCRIRGYDYLKRYGNEATFRMSRPSGVKTELEKMMEGWGRYSFYGFANREGTGLERWFILDLNVLREYIKNLKQLPELHRNPDGTTFWAFNVWSIPGFVVDSSENANVQRRASGV